MNVLLGNLWLPKPTIWLIFPTILPLLFPPKEILPPFKLWNLINMLGSPVICLEQPLSKYHFLDLLLVTCKNHRHSSLLWYPDLFGSLRVSGIGCFYKISPNWSPNLRTFILKVLWISTFWALECISTNRFDKVPFEMIFINLSMRPLP